METPAQRDKKSNIEDSRLGCRNVSQPFYIDFSRKYIVIGGEENEKSKKPINPCGGHGVCDPLRYGRSD